MRCRNILLGGAFALTSSLVFTPGFAQDTSAAPADQSSTQTPADTTATATPAAHHVRHHVRTATREQRSEDKTTEQLNERQLAQAQSGANPQTAQAEPAASAGDTKTAMAAPSTEATGTAPAPSDTNSTVGPNQNPSNAGDTNATPPTKMSENTAPATGQNPNSSSSAQSGAMPISQVQNAQQKLAQAKVENTSGKPLGTVQQITRDANGATTKVQVELDQSLGLGVRSVWINADQLQYEPQNNAVTTNLTPEQLNSL